MRRHCLRAGLALALMLPSAASFAATPQPAPPGRPAPRLYAMGGGGDYAVIEAGSTAPDFSFETPGGWARLSDLRSQGHVLLVIGAGEPQLAALEHERPRLHAMGVVPVAVLDRRAGSCRALSARLGLSYALLADSRRVIGAQFNALNPASRSDDAAWFVIDRHGRVRDAVHLEWPAQPWTVVCSRALGLPEPDAPIPASYVP